MDDSSVEEDPSSAAVPNGGDGARTRQSNSNDGSSEPQAQEQPAAEPRRWTCEACGCNTNLITDDSSEADRTCSVCGTSQSSGASLFRRAGYAARASLFARSVAARRSFVNEELGLDGYEFWSRAMDGDVDMDAAEEDEHAIAALAMEVAGVGGGRGSSRSDRTGSRSLADAARSFALAASNREPEVRMEPDALWRAAEENGSLYQPKWMNPSQIGGRMRTGNGIEVGDGESQNIAYLPLGAGEGRALRALEAFPRSAPFASSASSTRSGQERRSRRVFGFKVSFDHPKKEKGKNMGGCYLIGVTTTSFAAFSERNALQQSPFFWGIEDGGNKYEGSRYQSGREAHRHADHSSYAVELGEDEAPRNDDSVLFGSRQTITCIVDLESRTLTFWRDDDDAEAKLLGTLVTGLPRTGQLYPIVVPYNAGSTVAITGMSGDPLPLLSSFVDDWKRAQQEKDSLRRKELLADRLALIEKGLPTAGLVTVMQSIFSQYCSPGHSSLGLVEASRLWYRCGLTLSSLREICVTKISNGPEVRIDIQDFLTIVQRIIEEDEKYFSTVHQDPVNRIVDFDVGDMVELVVGYERFGDAANGPLLPGERGTIIELQKGPSGERTSIRVLHSRRRWWYQPQSLVSEKSGLTDSPGIWFLKKILRMHGYHQRTLRLIVGTQLSASSFQVGDLVVPKKVGKEPKQEGGPSFGIDDAVGRVAPESSSSGSLGSSTRARGPSSVMVEFVSGAFAEGVSSQSASAVAEKSLECRRIPTSRLIHTSVFHGIDAAQQPRSGSLSARLKNQKEEPTDMIVDEDPVSNFGDEYSVDGGVLSDMQGMKYLDPEAINRIIKECDKTSSSLGALFEAGLPKTALQALDCVQKNIELAENDESLSQALTLLGKLAVLVAEKSFPDECNAKIDKELGTEDEVRELISETQPESYAHEQDDAAPMNGFEESLDRSSDETSRSSRSYSLQQRRRMLLSLMSRARQGDVGTLGEFVLSRDANGMPSIDISADAAAALFFGAPGEANGSGTAMEEGSLRLENSRPNEARGQAGSFTDAEKQSSEATVFDELLRGRKRTLRTQASQGKWTVLTSSVNSIVTMGILGNSLPWLNSLLFSITKKMPRKQASRELLLLKDSVDEDGMPLLLLAITLGCSVDVVRHLIRNGCPVGDTEIKLAAENNLAEVLSLLLHYKAYTENTVDLDKCSATIVTVIQDSIKRQEADLKKIRKAAREFLVPFFRTLAEICLTRRRLHHNENDWFGRAITGALIGNVELSALRKFQKPSSALNHEVDTERSIQASGMSSRGLMQTLPTSILGQSLGEEPSHLTTVLLLIEDYLCSKGVNDGNVGLTILLTLLQRFPSLHQSQELERYGFTELISSHDALASNKLADISARVAKRSPFWKEASMDATCSAGVVLCPKKHTASLHLTKHASFRCDLCGKGVDKGAIMHGCRQCDWDACESCTDKIEGGMVKWRLVRELSSKCQNLLCHCDDLSPDDAMKEDNEWSERMVENLKSMDNTSTISTLSIALLQRDPSSVETLAMMLNSSGQITIHQFLTVILPALHSSLMGKNVELRSKKNRRSKKPRVAGCRFSLCDTEDKVLSRDDERIEFAKHVLASLVCHQSNSKCCNDDHKDPSSPSRDPEQSKLDKVDDDSEGSDEDDDDDDDIDDGEEKTELSPDNNKRSQLSGLMRRLHQVLTLHEDVECYNVSQSGQKDAVSPNELRSLKNPIKIILSQSDQKCSTTVLAEPLVSVSDLSRQLLKTALIGNAQYSAFCEGLVDDNAIILERPSSRSSDDECTWRIAKITSYDCNGGWHTVSYASSCTGHTIGQRLQLSNVGDFARLRYEVKTQRVMLSSREYFVLFRDNYSSELKSRLDISDRKIGHGPEEKFADAADSSVIGAQVESDFSVPEWRSYTVVAVDSTSNNKLYALVSETGEVICGVPQGRIRGLTEGTEEINGVVEPSGSDRRSVSRSQAFPFLPTRRQLSEEDIGLSAPKKASRRTLKRTWSALAPVESMRPVEIIAKPSKFCRANPSILSWKSDLGQVQIEEDLVDRPPTINVSFSSRRFPSPINISFPSDTTLVALLCQLHRGEEFNIFEKEGHHVMFTISFRPSIASQTSNNLKRSALEDFGAMAGLIQTPEMLADETGKSAVVQQSRSRKLSDSQLTNFSDEEYSGILQACDGLDEICIQCLEIVEFLAEVDSRRDSQKQESMDSTLFVNQGLSRKLTEQLENPLIVVGGAVPSWCLELPSFSPHVFTYASRKMLMDRVAFGISRSAMRQQETKVNVGRLRQRMTALRARAVELVGEAFSGGAQDPTALQLQADELYGMEEALGARIRSSFRAEGWQELSIEVAKAAIHRDLLISDAMSIMDQYSSDPRLNRRRLEVRFDGESGFDAASGDEAGVTRGFYADVAEALLSCDVVAGVCFSAACPEGTNTLGTMDSISFCANGEPKCKLPLWIPDVDSTSKVIIPTPRASPASFVGVFPRPLSRSHPQFGDVLRTFRFIGRLFAAAMRDGFMFPLPLSASFLKLVQHSGSSTRTDANEDEILSSSDLPRPGFLGGEVFAAEMYICGALDKIDGTRPPLNNLDAEREYRRIASDKTFAQIALGKSYECSFEDYFEDKTFVDPLDPEQGTDAYPLCQHGHSRRVTIHNIREWVSLAKDFMLYDGVIRQAAAFRAGVDDFFSSDYLRLFTSEELQSDVCGVGDNVDNWTESDIRKLFKLDGKGSAEALVAVAAIGGNAEALSRRFGPSSPTIKFVIKALLQATSTQRRQFLNFVTSVPIVTPGQIEVVPVVSSSGEFLPMKDPGCLPRANTCARRLYLPKFESYESFKKVIWAVVEEEFKHKGFFEWSL